MGNHNTTQKGQTSGIDSEDSTSQQSKTSKSKRDVSCLVKLFEKLELTAENDNNNPGVLMRGTFENTFHGPLQKFGKLMFIQMVGHRDKDRIPIEQFVKAGKEILDMYEEEQQKSFYFLLFSSGRECINKEGALQMVNICYTLTLAASLIPYSKSKRDDHIFDAVVNSMFGQQEQISYDGFNHWLGRHLPHMYYGVHNWVMTILTGSKLPDEETIAPVPQLDRFVDGSHAMCMSMLWSLSATLPSVYTQQPSTPSPKVEESYTANPLSGKSHSSYHQYIMKLTRLPRCQSWTLLYNSSDHGLSMNRFSHHVSAYLGPTITLLEFEGRNVYCIATDVGWREHPSKFGGNDSVVIQLSPIFRVVQSGSELLLWNEHVRDLPKGIQVGRRGESVVLLIPQSFDSVHHYGVPCNLFKVEVWACGGRHTLERQQSQQRWEQKEAEKHATRKLRMDPGDWNENPDKQLLEWGTSRTSYVHDK